MTARLTAEGVEMRFGGIVALAGADIAVEAGRIAGLIGRNGSGKSTLFNCITGFLKPSGGRVAVEGREITGFAPNRVVRAGVARTFQTPRLDFHVTVREAVRCGFYTSLRSSFLEAMLSLPRARREERRLAAATDALLERLGLLAFAAEPIGRLSMGRVRLVEVARCMAADARFILLDEPAAGLAEEEQALLAEQIRSVAAGGIGVLLVEHNFSLIRRLCERVTVLESGRVLASGTPDAVAGDERVVEAYLGAAETQFERKAAE